MGRLEAFTVQGCRCWFYSGDHSPPHFHVAVADEWEIRVFFLQEPVQYDVKYMIRRIPGTLLKTVLREAKKNRTALFKEWEGNQTDE